MFSVLAASGGDTAGSLQSILGSATQMLTWFLTSMKSILDFIISNPVCLMLFLILICGSAVGMLFRIWHSA